MVPERLQKILARAGYGSRRSSEKLIIDRRVAVNGIIAELGSKADPANDRITVDGRVLDVHQKSMYIALYKPRGVISDDDPHDPRPNIFGLVPQREHLFPVGRLDYDSEGLILLTNDGELANRLTHPRYEHEKEYRVQVATKPDEEQLQIWRRGVVLEDGYRTAAARVDLESPKGSGTWLRVVMHEGRKRQIREIGNRIGLPVRGIIRVRIGTLQLGSLKPGDWRELTSREVDELKTAVQASSGTRTNPRRRTGVG